MDARGTADARRVRGSRLHKATQVITLHAMDTIDRDNTAAKPAAKPRAAKVLRAKPVKGEVDHEALSREFMARFPKLRAALAK